MTPLSSCGTSGAAKSCRPKTTTASARSRGMNSCRAESKNYCVKEVYSCVFRICFILFSLLFLLYFEVFLTSFCCTSRCFTSFGSSYTPSPRSPPTTVFFQGSTLHQTGFYPPDRNRAGIEYELRSTGPDWTVTDQISNTLKPFPRPSPAAGAGLVQVPVRYRPIFFKL